MNGSKIINVLKKEDPNKEVHTRGTKIFSEASKDPAMQKKIIEDSMKHLKILNNNKKVIQEAVKQTQQKPPQPQKQGLFSQITDKVLNAVTKSEPKETKKEPEPKIRNKENSR